MRVRTQEFDARQIREFVKAVRKRWGDFAWRQLGQEVRDALLCQFAIGILIGQEADAISTDAIADLIGRMRSEDCHGEGAQ